MEGRRETETRFIAKEEDLCLHPLVLASEESKEETDQVRLSCVSARNQTKKRGEYLAPGNQQKKKGYLVHSFSLLLFFPFLHSSIVSAVHESHPSLSSPSTSPRLSP